MSSSALKWIKVTAKLAVCAGALWYLSGKVTLNDRIRLKEEPATSYVLVSDQAGALLLRHPESGVEKTVHRSAVMEGRRGLEPGMKTIVRKMEIGWAIWAFLAFGPVVFGGAWRLQRLLATQDIKINYRDATLLTFAGNFFNFAMPGTTGGDLYKAYHIAKRTHKRTEGVTIVFLDRALGLASFLLIAAATILASVRKPMIGDYGRWVGYLLAAFIIGCLLFFSRRVRRLIRYDKLLNRLPFGDKLRRIDETTFSFRHHHGSALLALLITVATHFCLVTNVYFMAHALGIQPHAGQTEADMYLACLLATVVGYLFAAVPITVQGFGLMEAVYIRVLVNGDWCNNSQMLALTLSIRLIQMIWALPGVLVPWLGFRRPREAELHAVEATPAA